METYLLEFIEVFTNLILYTTNVYSYEYFKKKRKLNTLIWHCTNKQVEKYLQQAFLPIKKGLSNKSLLRYRIIIKNMKNQILNIFTIEFDHLYKTYNKFSYSSFEQFSWDIFTYIEMQTYENLDIEKTFEISFDVLEDNGEDSILNENLKDYWEEVSLDNLEMLEKKNLKNVNSSHKNTSNPIHQIYIESRKSIN